ncbi:hypothetical protein STXM2123_3636 [Streptomyces sp. F-3]|nr:hypothetical protein STXM2123_3636 [Streptomyces sp. F-3]
MRHRASPRLCDAMGEPNAERGRGPSQDAWAGCPEFSGHPASAASPTLISR